MANITVVVSISIDQIYPSKGITPGCHPSKFFIMGQNLGHFVGIQELIREENLAKHYVTHLQPITTALTRSQNLKASQPAALWIIRQ